MRVLASVFGRCGLLLAFWASCGQAQQAVSLMEAQKPGMGWEFGNGPEFPGATGGLVVDATVKHNGRETLKLSGDFTKGGNYVQAGRKLEAVDARELSFWVRNPAATNFTLRLNDASGQTHQINIKTQGDDWERIVFPLERFFANRGRADAVSSVTKYEYWGGANDGNWHGPVTGIWLLLGKTEDKKARTLWLQDIVLTPRPPQVANAQVVAEISLDEILEGQHYWRLDFPPTTPGTLEVVKDQPAPAEMALKFSGDFSKGGGYVAMAKDLKELDLADVQAIKVKMKSDNVQSFGIQLSDGTGQTHQKKNIPITPDGQWHEVIIKPDEVAGIEHWGGANDGKWHGKPTGLVFNMNEASGKDTKQPVLFIADLRADAMQRAVIQPPAFKSDFEADQTPANWTVIGSATIDKTSAFKGKNTLMLSRPANDANYERAITATSRAFTVAPGQWQISAATKADLKSPDASYSGVINLELLDGAGKIVQTVALVDTFGQRNWTPVSKTIEVPKGVTTARFQARINKAFGQFYVDEVSASYLAPAPKKDNRIARLYFDTPQMGNLILPTEPRIFKVTLEAIKPLRDNQKNIACEVRDYWGAEQTKGLPVALESKGKKGEIFLYEGQLDLSQSPLEIGRYYEIHAAVSQEGDEPYRNYTTFAIVPEAITKNYKSEEIPFTSRSWDNRPTPHILLTDRLGIRICGLWGGWEAKAPYKADVPQIELVEKLHMGWLTGTPAHSIEQGKKDYDETALRQGVRNLIEKYGKVRPLYINLGNEPHGKGQQVLDNVEAYRVIYDEVKKVDPTVFVVATSVEPNEEYFKAGYGKYCDAYDFHIYESADNVRRSMREYKDLMKKYDVVKPIWSTELGLNSQGMTRYAVAQEVVRKFASFFAEGGQNVSWFGLMYPDSDTKNTGTSGEAHNIFDTRYGRYAPKLDAIADYNMINSIAIKKFVSERHYPDGINAFLFRDRDGKNLQILWKDKGRTDVSLPLSGAKEVQAIRLDGERRALNANNKAITLSISEDPILLLYDGAATLPDRLGAPVASLPNLPANVVRGGATTFIIALGGAAANDVNLTAPHFWDVKKLPSNNGKSVQFTVTSPEDSEVREADFTVTLGNEKNRAGELYFRAPVSGKLALRVLPEPARDGKAAGVKLLVSNNSKDAQQISWDMTLNQERALNKGEFGAPVSPGAYFAETATGALTMGGNESKEVVVPLANFDPLKIYHVKSSITDATGRVLSNERFLAGAVLVPKAKASPKLDGVLDEALWQNAPAQNINSAEQFYAVGNAAAPWKGGADLSSKLRFLWDEKYLYIGAEVTDDKSGNLLQDAMIWAQDGLQFLIDPSRESSEKPGKYDYGVALSKKGPQAWRFLSADAGALTGEAKEVLVSAKRGAGGNITYAVAFLWSSLAPFKPSLGANLGLTMAINEDDGLGRKSFVAWFGNAHTKQVDTVGDLILGE